MFGCSVFYLHSDRTGRLSLHRIAVVTTKQKLQRPTSKRYATDVKDVDTIVVVVVVVVVVVFLFS